MMIENALILKSMKLQKMDGLGSLINIGCQRLLVSLKVNLKWPANIMNQMIYTKPIFVILYKASGRASQRR